MEFQNQRYYSLCRYDLDKKPSFIYEEVKELFNQKSITISHIYTWTHQYRNEKNEQKRNRLFEFDEYDKGSFENLRFELKNVETNQVKKIQFYALCRHQLNVKLATILLEINKLFPNDAPNLQLLNNWIFEFWKHNDQALSDENHSNLDIEKLLQENTKLIEKNLNLREENEYFRNRLDSVNLNTIKADSDKNSSQQNNDHLNQGIIVSFFNVLKENVTLKIEIANLEAQLNKMETLLNHEKINTEKMSHDFNERILSFQIDKIKLKESNQILELKVNQHGSHANNLLNELKLKRDEFDMLQNENLELKKGKETFLFKQYEKFALIEEKLNSLTKELNESESRRVNSKKVVDNIMANIMSKNSSLRIENEKALSLVDQYVEKLKEFESNLIAIEAQLVNSKQSETYLKNKIIKLKSKLDNYDKNSEANLSRNSSIEFSDISREYFEISKDVS